MMIDKKKSFIIGSILFVLMSAIFITACNKEDNKEYSIEEVRIASLKGPTSIGMIKLMEDGSNNETELNYNFTVAGTGDEISGGLINGDFDIAAIPCNLASVLFNKNDGKIRLGGINTLGVLYIIETGDIIHSVEDLRGKTIYSTGYGTTPQFTLNYLLDSYGMVPGEDITIEYKSEATEVAAVLSNSEDAIAMLPQPFVTTVMMNNDNVRIALDIEEEWQKASNGEDSVVTGVVVVRTEFVEKYPEVFETFMEAYEESVDFVNTNVEEAAKLVDKFDIFKEEVAKKAIPYCNVTMIRGKEMKDRVSVYLQALYEQNPAAIGGKMPGDDFYYIP